MAEIGDRADDAYLGRETMASSWTRGTGAILRDALLGRQNGRS
jgi:hypothetical protein